MCSVEGVCWELTSSWPSAHVEGRSWALIYDTIAGDSVDSLDSAYEFQTYDSATDLSQKMDFGPLWAATFNCFPNLGQNRSQGDPKAAQNGSRASQCNPKMLKFMTKERQKDRKPNQHYTIGNDGEMGQ